MGDLEDSLDIPRFYVSWRGQTHECRFLEDNGTAWWMERLRSIPGMAVKVIGSSRSGRPIYGIRIGDGPVHRSIVAGAHADEPAGPIAACVFAEYAAALGDSGCSWYIIPQVNPDGAEANKAWFAPVPDLKTYLAHVRREGPGDDIEFGYPGKGHKALRPENTAAAQFFEGGAPFVAHASLHSMGLASGAWFLAGKEWSAIADHPDRTVRLREYLSHAAALQGFLLHDIDRRGEKGFTRICRGFCTTPSSSGMRAHFQDDPDTANLFRLNSMEYIQSLGDDPLVMVSEIPNFALDGGWQPGIRPVERLDSPPPLPGETSYERVRDAMKAAMQERGVSGAAAIARQHGAVPVPFSAHVTMQLEMLDAMIEATKP